MVDNIVIILSVPEVCSKLIVSVLDDFLTGVDLKLLVLLDRDLLFLRHAITII